MQETDLNNFEKEKRDFIKNYGDYEEKLEKNEIDSGLKRQNSKDDKRTNYVEQKELKIGNIENVSETNEFKNKNDLKQNNGNSIIKMLF